jgi:hypothetical protein
MNSAKIINSTILEEKCEILLNEREVLFAGFINKRGRLVAGGFKAGAHSIEDKAERQKMYMEHTLMASMRKDFDYYFGSERYTASKREKVSMISFSIDSSVFLVAVDSTTDVEKEANKIEKIITREFSCMQPC